MKSAGVAILISNLSGPVGIAHSYLPQHGNQKTRALPARQGGQNWKLSWCSAGLAGRPLRFRMEKVSEAGASKGGSAVAHRHMIGATHGQGQTAICCPKKVGRIGMVAALRGSPQLMSRVSVTCSAEQLAKT